MLVSFIKVRQIWTPNTFAKFQAIVIDILKQNLILYFIVNAEILKRFGLKLEAE